MRLTRTLRFVLIVLVGWPVADRAISWGLDIAYRHDRLGQAGGQINRYLRSAPPEVLVMGSSRAHHAVIPALLTPGCYNLSHNGMNVVFQAGLVDVLDAAGAMPRELLLLQLQPEDLMVGSEALRHMQYLKYHHGRVPYITTTIDGLRWSERIKYLAGAYRFNGAALTIPLNAVRSRGEREDTEQGYEPLPARPEDSAAVVLTAMRERQGGDRGSWIMPGDPLATSAGRALQLIREHCEARGVRLVVFTAPYYQVSAWRLSDQGVIAEALRRAGFHYLNYAIDPVRELRAMRYWVDNDHLNDAGARLFTHRLRHDLIANGWSSAPAPPPQ